MRKFSMERRLGPIDQICESLGLNLDEAGRFLTQMIFMATPEGEIRLGVGPFLPVPATPESEHFYLPGFFEQTESQSKIYPSKILKVHLKDLKLPEPPALPEPRWDEPNFNDFATRVERVKEQFKTTELRKVLPVVRWKSDWTPNTQERWALWLKIMEFSKTNYQNTRGYTYGYWDEDEGFIGRTPELLFELSGQKLSTMALAGTAWAGKAGALKEDPKEKEEHQWVVREILSKLNARGEFKAGDLQVLKAGSVEHLYTPIEGELNSTTSSEEICRDLHPTPALGGYPQALAQKWLIVQPEAGWRGYFGGPLGFETQDGDTRRSQCVVLIRGLFWNAHESFIPCGCGIVMASEPEREWTELAKKKDSVARMLGWSR